MYRMPGRYGSGDDLHRCRRCLSCAVWISSIRERTRQMASGRCAGLSSRHAPDPLSAARRTLRRMSPDRFPSFSESSACTVHRSHRAIGLAIGRLASAQRLDRAWSCPCCAPGTACHQLWDGSCATGRKRSCCLLLLAEPADDIIWVVTKMAADPACLRADPEVTPLI